MSTSAAPIFGVKIPQPALRHRVSAMLRVDYIDHENSVENMNWLFAETTSTHGKNYVINTHTYIG